jgi:anti-sigma-K factor RskA
VTASAPRPLWERSRCWRAAAAVLATTALALLVAALIARAPPDFAERAVVAVLRDPAQRPAWSLRLARAAHQIAIDSLGPPPPPGGKTYRLWLTTPGIAAPQPLGQLPLAGRKVIAETPATIRRLAGTGELLVTLEPAEGPLAEIPSAPPVFRARLDGAGQRAGTSRSGMSRSGTSRLGTSRLGTSRLRAGIHHSSTWTADAVTRSSTISGRPVPVPALY